MKNWEQKKHFIYFLIEVDLNFLIDLISVPAFLSPTFFVLLLTPVYRNYAVAV